MSLEPSPKRDIFLLCFLSFVLFAWRVARSCGVFVCLSSLAVDCCSAFVCIFVLSSSVVLSLLREAALTAEG
jgi:hypothetical protein